MRRADGHWRIRFDLPQRAVATGQRVALYDGERCLGGGGIDHCGPPVHARTGLHVTASRATDGSAPQAHA